MVKMYCSFDKNGGFLWIRLVLTFKNKDKKNEENNFK